jgi:hypothetical protein
MAEKPNSADGYRRSDTRRVYETCLEIATRLGDLKHEVCIVGGLVPLLTVDQSDESPGFEAHVGTLDVDLGLAIAVVNTQRYQEISERLRRAGFRPDENEAGRQTTQRWKSPEGVIVDFLIPPTSTEDQGGKLKNLEHDFAAIIAPGLELAFQDCVQMVLKGNTPSGTRAEREITVCGPAAFVVLKALAFRRRGENKDAYDLFYILRHHQAGIDGIARTIVSFGAHPQVTEAITILREDFASPEHLGPSRVAEFITGVRDEDIQADAYGAVADLLDSLGAEAG